jgi:hypothetical protein
VQRCSRARSDSNCVVSQLVALVIGGNGIRTRAGSIGAKIAAPLEEHNTGPVPDGERWWTGGRRGNRSINPSNIVPSSEVHSDSSRTRSKR